VPEGYVVVLQEYYCSGKSIIGTPIDIEAITETAERRYKHIDDMIDEEIRQAFDDVQDLLRDANYE
jgi:hypothetical protein